jgi:hypothetical protein
MALPPLGGRLISFAGDYTNNPDYWCESGVSPAMGKNFQFLATRDWAAAAVKA